MSWLLFTLASLLVAGYVVGGLVKLIDRRR
jgi:hypothetical protein